MIVLFNLNQYLGGGEVLLLRFADFLFSKRIPFVILCHQQSYIKNTVNKNGYPLIEWTLDKDAFYYFEDAEHSKVNSISAELENLKKDLRFFTFCLRDCYNVIQCFSKLNCFESLVTGVYHPLDVNYLCSLNLHKQETFEHNRSTFSLLNENKSVVFMNQIGAEYSIGESCIDANRLIPIPIEIKFNPLTFNIPSLEKDALNITCISRFVGFKMPAVMHFLNTAKQMKQHKFTLIGHGFWAFFVKNYISAYSLNNVELFTNVNHQQIEEYIDKTDIGFAQGTSALEFAASGKMVVIAPYSTLGDFIKCKTYFCHGYFSAVDTHLGDEHYQKMQSEHTLRHLIEHYGDFIPVLSDKFNKSISTFDKNNVFEKLLGVIRNSNPTFVKFNFDFRPNLLIKKIIKKILRNS